MRQMLAMSFVIFAAACADQATDPCVLHLAVVTPATITVGTTRNVVTEKGVISGKCTFPTNAHLNWSTSNANVLSINSSNDSTASVHAIKAGAATISAWLVLTPAVRDSVVLTAVPPTDIQ